MTFNLGRDVNYTDANGIKKKLSDELAKIGTGGSGGSSVTDSTTNGNILINGVEVTVYDESALNNKIGNLENLQTTEKSNIVGAINEIKQSGGGGLSAPIRTEENQEFVYFFDINSILVSDKQVTLTIPVQSYNNGSTAVVHPSVLYFQNKWNGYHYWMGINPYMSTNFENPVILASNDGMNWVAPAGITNPIDTAPSSGYGSDINLFMSKDNKTMYVLNRHYIDTPASRTIYIYSSTDGVNWNWTARTGGASNRKIILQSSDGTTDFASPCVILDGGIYKMLAVDITKQTSQSIYNEIDVYTAVDPTGTWTKGTPIVLPYMYSDERIWHFEVRKVGNVYYMLYMTCDRVSSGAKGRVYIAMSYNLVNWEVNKTPISAIFNVWNKDSYKCSFLPLIDGDGVKFKVWYSYTGGAADWNLGYIELNGSKPKVLDNTPSGTTLLFHDNFTRAVDKTIKDATLGKWIVGTSNTGTLPLLQIGNGLATTSGGLGTDAIYTYINSDDYIVRIKIDEIGFSNATSGSTGNVFQFGVNSSGSNGFNITYNQSRLCMLVRKNSSIVDRYYFRANIKSGDIITCDIRNTEKKARFYLNGYFVFDYDDSVNQVMSLSNNRIGFTGSPSNSVLALQEIKVYGINYKDNNELIKESLTKLSISKGTSVKGDNFKKANSSSIGTLLDGTTWNQVSGTWAIEGNTLKQTATVDAFLTCDLTWRDYYLEINTPNRGGVLARYVDSSNYVVCEFNDADRLKLRKVVSGVNTDLLSLDIAVPITNFTGTNKIIGLSVVGNAFRVFVNNRLQYEGTIDDAVFATTTTAGIYAKYSQTGINYFTASKI